MNIDKILKIIVFIGMTFNLFTGDYLAAIFYLLVLKFYAK
jgi:hypothetical protein